MSKRGSHYLAVILAILIIAAGCSSAPASISSASAAPTSSSTVAISTAPAPSLSPVSTLAALPTLTDTAEPDTDATPEPIGPSGVWAADDEFGIKGYENNPDYTYAVDPFKAYQYDTQEERKSETKEHNKTVIIGQWKYYLDTDKPIEYIDDSYYIEFPLCRKDSKGNVEFLNIYGLDFAVISNYIFVYTKMLAGTDFATCNTWRVNLDGSEIKYVGQSPRSNLPVKGPYLYFTNSFCDCMQIYRTLDLCANVEKLNVEIPNWNNIEKATGIENYEDCSTYVNIKKVHSEWIYFSFTLWDEDLCERYIGNYNISLAGGLVQKTDKGKFIPVSEDDE